MYSELLSSDEGSKILLLTFGSLIKFISEIRPRKVFDFSAIRDSFRQHIHNRRNTDSSDLVLLDDQLIQNIQALKQETFALLQKFRNINAGIKQNISKEKNFASFEEFVSFVVNQEEILNSELWKVEAIFNYLEALNPSLDHFRSPNISIQGI